MTTDLATTIEPKSDQLNSDDLIAKTLTIKVTKVSKSGTPDQPISINFEGDNGKPYKPCKGMRRILVQVWGRDGAAYVGKSMTLYRDEKVKWGGVEVGGIRISHMSGITEPVTMALTASKTSRKPYTVKPLKVEAVKEKTPSAKDALIAAISKIGGDLNKAGDSINWKPSMLVQYASQLFGEDVLSLDSLADASLQSLSEDLQVRLDELKGATETDPPDHADPSITADEPPDTDEPEMSDIDRLRANCQSALDELPDSVRKNLLQGKAFIKDMDEAEITALLADVGNALE